MSAAVFLSSLLLVKVEKKQLSISSAYDVLVSASLQKFSTYFLAKSVTRFRQLEGVRCVFCTEHVPQSLVEFGVRNYVI